jgi:hypothetical protein
LFSKEVTEIYKKGKYFWYGSRINTISQQLIFVLFCSDKKYTSEYEPGSQPFPPDMPHKI